MPAIKMAALPPVEQVNTRDPHAVCAAVIAIAHELFREKNKERIEGIFRAVTDIFEGRFSSFQRMDAAYHNLEHTLQTTLCWAHVFRSFQRYGGSSPLSADSFFLGLTAALLHDIGYLKEKHDSRGTGAKFFAVHEERSCELAHIFLVGRSWNEEDILTVQQIIRCTGQNVVIDAIPFRNESKRVLGQMLSTADYLGQMSDPQYLEKLSVLFQEFSESDDYQGVPRTARSFACLEDLLAATPDFWYGSVLPRLDYDCGGLYRYLASPYPHGPNHYLEAVHRNLDRVPQVLAEQPTAFALIGGGGPWGPKKPGHH